MRFFRNLKIIFFALIVLSFFSLNSCNDKPTVVGYSLITDTITVKAISSTDTLLITDQRSFQNHDTLINSGGLFIGRHKDYKAYSFIRFLRVPDSLSYLTLDKIVSANFMFSAATYAFGNTENNFLSFKMFKIKKLWTNKFTIDSIKGSGYNEYIDNVEYGSFQGQFSPKDSLDTTYIPINKDLIAYWASLAGDSNTNSTNYGIAFVPDENSTVIRKIYGQAINANNFVPRVQLLYLNQYNELDTIELESGYEKSLIDAPEPPANRLVSQGLVSCQSFLFFDVSMMPGITGIHNAELTLTLDTKLSEASNLGLDSIIRLELYEDTTMTNLLNQYDGYKIANSNKYFFRSISSAVETWNRKSTKGVMCLRPSGATNLYRRIDRLVFYGINEEDKSLRPYLRIIYSTRPVEDFK